MVAPPPFARGVMVAAQVVASKGESIKDVAKRLGDVDAHVEVGYLQGIAKPDVIERAYYHEFGTRNVPERSFIRSTLRKNERRYVQMQKRLAQAVADGRMTQRQALEALGDEISADMQAAIQHNIPPPLKAATVKAKKRKMYARPNIALVATGEMRAALARRFVGAR